MPEGHDDGEIKIKLFPDPVLDEDMVDVQSDPSKIKIKTNVGRWRLDSKSGRFLRNQVRKSLREKVIAEGKKDMLIELARRNAKSVLLELFERLSKEKNLKFNLNNLFN